MSTVTITNLQKELEELRKDNSTLHQKIEALHNDGSAEFAKLATENATFLQKVDTLNAKVDTLKTTTDLILATVNPLMLPFLRDLHVVGQTNDQTVTEKKLPTWTYMHYLVDGVQRLVAVGAAHHAL